MFILNRLTRVLRNVVTSEGEQGGGGNLTFNPTEVTQGVGLLDTMKADAVKMQANEEETGSVSPEPTSDTVVDKKTEVEQSAAAPAKDAQNEGEGSSADDKSETVIDGLSFQGVAIEVTNTPEMIASFKEKELDIDAVNKEIYSKDGLTEATRTKLNEAFGKSSVDMYLDGLTAKNEAMVNEHNKGKSESDDRITAITASATGDKFDDVMKWANDNLDSKDYAKYADIINGTNEFQIELALKDLTSKSGIQSNKLDQPAVKVNDSSYLITADNKSSTDESGPIGSAAYREAITSGAYNKDMKSWDARRQAGIDASIA